MAVLDAQMCNVLLEESGWGYKIKCLCFNLSNLSRGI